MTNKTNCPNCGEEIDATQAALERGCPNCPKSYTQLVRMASDDHEPPEMEYPVDGPGGTQ